MKEFLSTYIELLQNNHDMVGQVHSEFKRQFLEMTVDKLLEQFVLSKYTGLEKPGKWLFLERKIRSQMEHKCSFHTQIFSSCHFSFTLNLLLSLCCR